MSVDFKHCESCGESRYEESVGYCEKCGNSLCVYCLINDDINSNCAYDYQVKFDGTKEQMDKYGFDESYGYEIGDSLDDVGIDSKYCPFCNGNKASDNDLLYYALKIIGKTKDELREQFIKNKEYER